MYKEPKNSPFVPNVQKQIITEKIMEDEKFKPYYMKQQQQPSGEKFKIQNIQQGMQQGISGLQSATQQPLIDLQIYDPAKPMMPKKQPEYPLFAPLPTNNPYYPPQWTSGMPGMVGMAGMPGTPGMPYATPYSYVPNSMPIIKNYSINVGGVAGDHQRVAAIYEDILPSKQLSTTSNTCQERLDMHTFARSIFIRQDDGEDVNLDGKSDNSLLRYLKFIELNPYNTNQLTDNPYKGLPDDMLIYRSCYPIRFDKYSGTTQCAVNSVGMNIRIYKITVEEYNLKKQDKQDFYNYNVWREIAYYEYIREKIIKTKQCPNFPIMYAYFICQNCGIDFAKLKKIKGKDEKPEARFIAKFNKELLSEDHNYEKINMTGGAGPTSTPLIAPHYVRAQGISGMPVLIESTDPKANELLLNDKLYNGQAIIALTEAPTYNLFGWATKTYKVEGNLRRMINPGFHKAEIWYSVIFQIMAALYVLQIHKLTFKQFSVLDNIYIKDTKVHDNSTNYWKYIIDGIDYYIPNYGYLVMIDSNYKDLNNDGMTVGVSDKTKKFKLNGNIFKGGSKIDENDDDLNNMCFKAFQECINPNVFSKSFTNSGGVRPSEEIIKLLDKIYTSTNSSTDKDIGKYIFESMRLFMNNRVGTILKEDEIANIIPDSQEEFKKGQLVVEEFQNNTFRFVMFLEHNANGTTKVLARNAPIRWNSTETSEIIQLDVNKDMLRQYSKYIIIEQNFKADNILNEDKLLETYIINKS